MGLFDKALKKAVGSVLNDAVSGALKGDLGQKLENATGLDLNGDGVKGADPFRAPQASQAPPAQTPGYNPSSPLAGSSDNQPKNCDYFVNLIGQNFPQFTIQTREYPAPFARPTSQPYDLTLYQDGRAVAAIILTKGNRYRSQAFKDAKADSEAAGVPFMNFFLRLPNRPDYVVDRIKTNLGL
jgi:hypothetical protein